MKQYPVPAELKVNLDYSNPSLPSIVRLLKPLVVHDGDAYCCVLGPDPQSGVFGCGDTPKDALDDWQKHLKERVKRAEPNDEVVEYVIDTLRKNKIIE